MEPGHPLDHVSVMPCGLSVEGRSVSVDLSPRQFAGRPGSGGRGRCDLVDVCASRFRRELFVTAKVFPLTVPEGADPGDGVESQ